MGQQGGTTGGRQLTPQELREQRLARLDNQGAKKAPPPAVATMETCKVDTVEDEDDSTMEADQDLQAAIALSMGLPLPSSQSKTAATPPSTAPSTPMRIEDDDDDDAEMVDRKTPASKNRRIIPRKDPSNFSGRVRTWYKTGVPFSVLDFHDYMWDRGVTTPNDQKRWLSQGIQFKDEHPEDKPIKEASSLLAAIISGPGVWCLTQQHGGPCGVLASIQAELLAILLFGPRTVHPISMISIDFPISLESEFTRAPPDMSFSKMRQVLALSMGMILARASLVPSATLSDDASKINNENTAQWVLLETEPTVRLVLPKNELWDTEECLEWEHLQPWEHNEGTKSVSDHLFMYSISLPKNRDDDDAAAAAKRHKRDFDVEHFCRELAHATAQFLLETNSLDWFQRPGGVLLMVMSMTASRGISKTKAEMDDVTAKLTTSFGHCSQELINLLLTGQAVSNVFDHTLRPSGELVCRGIQSQPAIGYLTQLEAMRYLEVGAFFKTPRFPVWVIGSTAHFTVMFGDGSALKESASDALLEKVRRAFKRMDGGAEENGFLQTTQLGTFLKSVDLKLSEHEIQMLGALMDKYCAGIILWEDLWKTTSRLLTGASIESIIDGTDEKTTAEKTSETNETAGLSDEELARRLQAEWNGVASDEKDPTPTDLPASKPPSKETFGRTFQLYHYNGLRGGKFKPFRVTRLSADEAIGASVALGSANQSSHTGSFGGEFDSVLRTKWPGCRIHWIKGSSPSID